MIYNKMNYMLNDHVQMKKRLSNGSRNLNAQAKLMITQPSEMSMNTYEDGGMQGTLSPLSAMRYKKMTLPSLQSPSDLSKDHKMANQIQQI